MVAVVWGWRCPGYFWHKILVGIGLVAVADTLLLQMCAIWYLGGNEDWFEWWHVWCVGMAVVWRDCLSAAPAIVQSANHRGSTSMPLLELGSWMVRQPINMIGGVLCAQIGCHGLVILATSPAIALFSCDQRERLHTMSMS